MRVRRSRGDPLVVALGEPRQDGLLEGIVHRHAFAQGLIALQRPLRVLDLVETFTVVHPLFRRERPSDG